MVATFNIWIGHLGGGGTDTVSLANFVTLNGRLRNPLIYSDPPDQQRDCNDAAYRTP